MMVRCVFALFLTYTSLASGLNIYQQPGPEATASLMGLIQTVDKDTNPTIVAEACQQLAQQLHDNSSMVVNALDVMAQAAYRFIEDATVSAACVNGISLAEHFGTLLDQTKAFNVLMDVAKKHSHNRNVSVELPMIIGRAMLHASPQANERFRNLGGLDVIFNAILNFANDGEVVTNAYQSLQYFTHQSAEGAAMVAHYGGKFKGISLMVDQLREHNEVHFLEDPQRHIGFTFAIVSTMDGIFMNDDPLSTYVNESVKDGYIEVLLNAMRTDADRRQLQYAACSNVLQMASHRPTVENLFIEKGLLDIFKNIFETMNFVDDTPFLSSTVGEIFPCMEMCANALSLLGRTSNENRLKIRKLGLPKLLMQLLPDLSTDVVSGAIGNLCMGNMCV